MPEVTITPTVVEVVLAPTEIAVEVAPAGVPGANGATGATGATGAASTVAGPTGATGPAGPGALPLEFAQVAPAAQWNLTHPVGHQRLPLVLLDDDPTHPVYTDVEYVSDTLTVLLFPTPVSGWAYL